MLLFFLKILFLGGFAFNWIGQLTWMPDKFSPAHNILGREVRSGSSVWHRSVGEKLWPIKNCIGPIKLSGRALYDDGQMINRNVINHVTNARVEVVFNKHGCESVLEETDISL